MWEFLKSKKYKQQELIEKECKKAEFVQLKKDYTETIDRLNKILVLDAEKSSKANRERVDKANSICPKCGNKNIIDKISQIKGDLSGSSYSSGSLFGSSSYSSIHGSLDTLEVNKCPKCNHEWKKTFFSCHYETIEFKLSRLRYALENFDTAINCTFDENSITEKFTSLEEKRTALIEKARDSFSTKDAKAFFSGVKIDVLQLMINEVFNKSYDSYQKERINKAIINKDILINEFGLIN